MDGRKTVTIEKREYLPKTGSLSTAIATSQPPAERRPTRSRPISFLMRRVGHPEYTRKAHPKYLQVCSKCRSTKASLVGGSPLGGTFPGRSGKSPDSFLHLLCHEYDCMSSELKGILKRCLRGNLRPQEVRDSAADVFAPLAASPQITQPHMPRSSGTGRTSPASTLNPPPIGSNSTSSNTTRIYVNAY